MNLRDKVVLVTGGASGIGRALAIRFAAEGAAGIAIVDLDGEGVGRVAAEVDGLGLRASVAQADDIERAVLETERRFGPIDLFCSNAGVGFSDAPGWTAASQSDRQWQRQWDVNVMAHVRAARILLPGMIQRGGGYFLITASAAGLLSQIGDAAYATTKHAAIGFAEALAITHAEQGIGVSVLCPQAVDTPMVADRQSPPIAAARADGVLPVEVVAEAVVEGLAAEHFLILPHPQVREYLPRKVEDPDRWLEGMRRFRRTVFPDDRDMDADR